MRKIIIILMILIFTLGISGCGNNKQINGKEYSTYGLINEDDMKNPNVEYRLIPGNIIWGCLLVETIIAPIYIFGFSIYEPIGSKTTVEKGVINNTQS